MIINRIDFPRNSDRGFPKACPGYKYVTPDILLMGPREGRAEGKTLPRGENRDTIHGAGEK